MRGQAVFSIYNMEDKIISIPYIQTVKTWPTSWPLTANISLVRSDAVACLAIVSDTRQITCYIYPVSGYLLYSAGTPTGRWTENSTILRTVGSEENFVLYYITQWGRAVQPDALESRHSLSSCSHPRKPQVKGQSAWRTLQWCGDPCHDENRTTRADCSHFFSLSYRTADWQGSTCYFADSHSSSAQLLNCCFIPISTTLKTSTALETALLSLRDLYNFFVNIDTCEQLLSLDFKSVFQKKCIRHEHGKCAFPRFTQYCTYSPYLKTYIQRS
jgi:hypothetical protein